MSHNEGYGISVLDATIKLQKSCTFTFRLGVVSLLSQLEKQSIFGTILVKCESRYLRSWSTRESLLQAWLPQEHLVKAKQIVRLVGRGHFMSIWKLLEEHTAGGMPGTHDHMKAIASVFIYCVFKLLSSLSDHSRRFTTLLSIHVFTYSSIHRCQKLPYKALPAHQERQPFIHTHTSMEEPVGVKLRSGPGKWPWIQRKKGGMGFA